MMNEVISKCICPSWQRFECLGVAQSTCHIQSRACPAADS